jgi:hypothetical protein
MLTSDFNFRIFMKKIYISLTLVALLVGAGSCDKDFEQINTNPNSATDLDPAYLLNSAQLGSARTAHHYEGEIVQQVNTPYTGVLEGGNHNILNDVNTRTTFNEVYTGTTGPIRNLVIVLDKTKDKPEQVNIHSMARILKAYNFMVLVDTYGDVPYFNAGKAFLESNYLPEYDDQAAIYDDILKELEAATKALDASKPTVSGGDIFYNGNISRWQKLGNSLLLRAAMRYTELNPTKAGEWVAKAAAGPGGFMTSNDDNAAVRYNAPAYVHATTQQLLSTERANFFAGQPFVEFMKSNNDPRAQYIFVRYSTPGEASGGTMNTNLADQFGLPYGYSDVTLRNAPGYRGALTEYSYLRRNTVLDQNSPEFLVTFAQTQLLLADAVKRGFISGGDAAAKTYYETGIKAHMDELRVYNTGVVNITDAQKNAYLTQTGDPASADPIRRVGVQYDPAKALEQINTQYWVASFRNWAEAWANFRRTEFPRLKPINYPGEDPSVKTASAGGFIRRLPYPNREISVNAKNVEAAVARMGGNTLGTRIFWDKQ